MFPENQSGSVMLRFCRLHVKLFQHVILKYSIVYLAHTLHVTPIRTIARMEKL